MDKKKKVAILGTNGLPAKYGGFETLTNYLVQFLGEDFDITVYCSKTPREKRLKTFNNAKLKYFPFKANGWQSIVYDFVTIFHAFLKNENLIILGSSGAFAFPFNSIFRKNIIFNIGGIEWKKVRGVKMLSYIEIRLKKLMEKLCVKNSCYVVIDNITFKDYIVNNYHMKPVLAEYGGDHAIKSDITDDLIPGYSFLKSDYDLTVSRAQEDMNIHIVIEAYKKVSNRTIVIVSNWNISEYGKRLYSLNHDKNSNIILLNAIYDQDVLNVIRSNCKLYVHTHSLCGTAPSLVEAMSLNLPIICFDVPTNRATTEEKSLYFSNSNSLVKLLREINDKDLFKIKNEMYEIASRRYIWKRIASIYRKCILNINTIN